MVDGISNINVYLKTRNFNGKVTKELTENSSLRVENQEPNSDTRIASIRSKMQQGKKISHAEKAYLRKNLPELYQKATRVENMRDNFERKIRNCKSKIEFNRLRMQITQSSLDIASVNSSVQNFNTTQNTSTSTIPNDISNKAEFCLNNKTSDPLILNEQQALNSTLLENDFANYAYRSLNDAYRTFKQSESYRKLPIVNNRIHKIDIKA